MTRRRWTLFLPFVFIAMILATAFALDFFSKKDTSIQQALYNRVKLGMTLEEVSLAIPFAPGDYSAGYAYCTSCPIREGELPLFIDDHRKPDGSVVLLRPVIARKITGKWWRGQEGMLMVFFGPENQVIDRRWYPGYPQSRVQYYWARLVR